MNQQPDHESEYEVKRENPYLRKNRKKNAESKSKESPHEPAADSIAEPVTDAPSVSENESTPAPSPRRRQSAAKDRATSSHSSEGDHKSTFSDFIFEHIKLFTAILTCLLILSLVFITDVTGWLNDIKVKLEQNDKTPLTLSHVRALTNRGDYITWIDMTDFVRYDTDVVDDSITWKFKVNAADLPDAELELWISGVDTDHSPTYVYLYDFNTGERMNLNKDHLDVFLDKIS